MTFSKISPAPSATLDHHKRVIQIRGRRKITGSHERCLPGIGLLHRWSSSARNVFVEEDRRRTSAAEVKLIYARGLYRTPSCTP
jgi:hypothetical protein